MNAQRKKLQTGDSLINWMMANNSSKPIVGEYCIEIQPLDRDSHIVKKVVSDKEVVIEYCHSEHDKSMPGGCGHQNWIAKPSGHFFTLYYRWGAWRTEDNSKYRCFFSPNMDTYRCWEF